MRSRKMKARYVLKRVLVLRLSTEGKVVEIINDGMLLNMLAQATRNVLKSIWAPVISIHVFVRRIHLDVVNHHRDDSDDEESMVLVEGTAVK
jgi:hypothetical protein